MTARILDGLEIRDQIFAELKGEIAAMTASGTRPGLAAVLVGDNPASQLYVKSKIAACEQLGIASWMHTPPATVSTREMLQLVDDLNGDPAVDGILIQLPLPPQVDTKLILESVDPAKDVDGFHPYNVGRLVAGNPLHSSCTPSGILELLDRSGIELSGKEAVVVGRSNIVGKPMALMLLARNATVTICHTKTKDLAAVTRRADILVAAAGRAQMIKGDMVKDGVVIIDVGTNRTDTGKLVGDVAFAEVFPKASYITTVPGGVGPMIITMLMLNTLRAAQFAAGA